MGETGGGEQTSSIRFAPSVEAVEAGDFTTKFELLEVRDIVAVVPVVVESGIQFVRFDVELPAGTPYQTIWRAYTTDPDPPSSTTHPTLGTQVPVSSVVDIGGEPHVFLGIAVAGTDITQYKLTGVYPVEARLGSEEVPPLFATGSFEIYHTMAAESGGAL